MSKKCWPSDAVIVVGAVGGTERRERMSAVVEVTCRDCRSKMAVDPRTIRQGEELPGRMGRPVEFLCEVCEQDYDPTTIEELHGTIGGGK